MSSVKNCLICCENKQELATLLCNCLVCEDCLYNWIKVQIETNISNPYLCPYYLGCLVVITGTCSLSQLWTHPMIPA